MKKKLLLFLLLAGALATVNSCSQETAYPGDEPYADTESWQEFLTRAQEFFESTYSPEAKTRTAQYSPVSAMLSAMEVDPNWEFSLYSENDDEAYLEFPLISDYRLGFTPPDPENQEEDVRQGEHRLVVRKDKNTGELELFTSLWIPDSEPDETLMPGLPLLDKADFSGKIFLFYPDGQFYRGVYFQEGRQTASLVITETSQQSASQTRSMGGCMLEELEIWERWCFYYANTGSLIGCTAWELAGSSSIMVCDNEGGSGGNTGDGNSSSTTTSKAQKLLKSTTLTDAEWEILEDWLDDILKNCMGNAMYNGLVNRMGTSRWTFVIDSTAEYDTFSGSTITLRSLDDPYAFMHELFHGYQAYQETASTFNAATANLEVEAQLAKVMYMLDGRNLDEYVENFKELREDDFMNNFLFLNTFLNHKGQLANSNHEDIFMTYFQKIGLAYTESDPMYKWDYDRISFNQNMKNIFELAKGC